MSCANEETRGGAAALSAYFLWGLFPLYFNALAKIPSTEVLTHRILGGALFAFAASAALGDLNAARAIINDRRRIWPFVASSLAIAVNWGLFIWAVAHGRALEASMGYFIFPLASLILARVVLGERLNRRRQAAVAVLASGVLWLAVAGQETPWVALALAASFSVYGLLRKTTPAPALAGLLIETMALSPLAALYLISQGGGVGFSLGSETAGLLLLAGPVTAVPLWMFAYGARRIRLSTLGLMMYVNPSVQILMSVFVLGEPFTAVHGVAFGAVWTGLAIYSWPEGRSGAPAGVNMRR